MECLNGAASVRTAELTVGGVAAPVHGLPLDYGRAAVVAEAGVATVDAVVATVKAVVAVVASVEAV